MSVGSVSAHATHGYPPGTAAAVHVPASADPSGTADVVFYVRGSEFRKIFVRDADGEVVEMLDRRKGTDTRWKRVKAQG